MHSHFTKHAGGFLWVLRCLLPTLAKVLSKAHSCSGRAWGRSNAGSSLRHFCHSCAVPDQHVEMQHLGITPLNVAAKMAWCSISTSVTSAEPGAWPRPVRSQCRSTKRCLSIKMGADSAVWCSLRRMQLLHTFMGCPSQGTAHRPLLARRWAEHSRSSAAKNAPYSPLRA